MKRLFTLDVSYINTKSGYTSTWQVGHLSILSFVRKCVVYLKNYNLPSKITSLYDSNGYKDGGWGGY